MRRKSIWNFWTRIKWEAKFTNLNWPPLTDLNQYVQNKKWLSQSVSEWVSQSVTRLPIELSTDSVWTAKKVVRDRQTHLRTYSLEQPFRCLNYTTINHISMNIKVWKMRNNCKIPKTTLHCYEVWHKCVVARVQSELILSRPDSSTFHSKLPLHHLMAGFIHHKLK